jgi:NitT/TauT family transport system permease protein
MSDTYSDPYRRQFLSEKFFAAPDALVLLFIGSAIYGLFALSGQFRSDFSLVTQIDLSPGALPYYAFLSASRGVVAYLISLIFTMVVGYAAAKSRAVEKIAIPMIDILQSLPVLSFLPGLVLGLTALFPHSSPSRPISKRPLR